MHFTDPVYRNPYWPTYPLLEITAGCTHNSCKFCTMYKGVKFKMHSLEQIEEDLKELSKECPNAKTIQLLSANPFALSYDRLAPILELVNKYLPHMEYIYGATRVTDICNKSVDELKKLKDLNMKEISLGVESGDDGTLDAVNKGYHASDIIEQCNKLNEAGINFWMTFLNGAGGKEHTKNHALNSAKIFSECKPMLVGTGGLVLFDGTPLIKDIEEGKWTALSEKEMLEELLLFVENLTCDCRFTSHHTVSADLNTKDFLANKDKIIKTLKEEIEHGDLDTMAKIRNNKRTL